MRIIRALGAGIVVVAGGAALAFAGMGSDQQGHGGHMKGGGDSTGSGGHMMGQSDDTGNMGGNMQGMSHHGDHETMSGHSHERCELHGGRVAMTKHNHFETTFGPHGIRVYCYTDDQHPMRVGDVTGTATLRFKDGTTKEVPLTRVEPEKGKAGVYFCPTDPTIVQDQPGKCGDTKLVAQDFLQGKVDLAGMEPGSMKVVLSMKNLGGDEPEATFTEAFHGFSRMHGTEGMEHHEKRQKEGGSHGS